MSDGLRPLFTLWSLFSLIISVATSSAPPIAIQCTWTYTLCEFGAGGIADPWNTCVTMTWHAAIGCKQCVATFRGRTTAFPLSQIAIVSRLRCLPDPGQDAPKVTAAAGELRNCARRLLKRAVRDRLAAVQKQL